MMDLTVWIEASIRKFFLAQDLGLPITFLQQGEEKEPNTSPGKINILTHGPDIPKVGSKSEVYAHVILEVFLQTRYVTSDPYYHQRMKGRIMESLLQTIPILKIGHESYDRSSYGYLTQIPSTVLSVNPVSVKDPNATTFNQVYKLEIC